MKVRLFTTLYGQVLARFERISLIFILQDGDFYKAVCKVDPENATLKDYFAIFKSFLFYLDLVMVIKLYPKIRIKIAQTLLDVFV